MTIARSLRPRSPSLILCLVATLLGCGGFAARPSGLTDEDYAVMSAVVLEFLEREPYAGTPRGDEVKQPIERVVIVGQPEPQAPATIAALVPETDRPVDATTVADYAAKAADRPPFERRFRGVGTYHVVPYDSMAAIFASGGFARFYETFPGAAGLFAFSRVGFSNDRTEAVVFMLHLRQGTWGHEDVLLLRKRADDWVVVGERRIADI